MAKTGGKNPNIMAKVFCPAKRRDFWANSNIRGEMNCCGCGNVHAISKGNTTLIDTPAKPKKAKYKKGKKQK